MLPITLTETYSSGRLVDGVMAVRQIRILPNELSNILARNPLASVIICGRIIVARAKTNLQLRHRVDKAEVCFFFYFNKSLFCLKLIKLQILIAYSCYSHFITFPSYFTRHEDNRIRKFDRITCIFRLAKKKLETI